MDYPEAVFEVYVNGENLYRAFGDDHLGQVLQLIGSDISRYFTESGDGYVTIEIEAHE